MIFLLALLLFWPMPAEAQRRVNCGVGRWVNGYFVCPPTESERIEQENQRLLRDQQRTLDEINRSNQAIANRPQAEPQVVIIKEVQKTEDPVVEKVEPATPQSLFKWKDEKGVWHFQSAPPR